MTEPKAWKGTPEEGTALLDAIDRECKGPDNGEGDHCVYEYGRRTHTCAAHTAFCEDQRVLDSLLFYRHLRDRLNREEGVPT